LAKDAFQETFIKVYEHRREFKGENFAAWLFTIARHTCLNMIRSRKEYDTFDEEFHSTQKEPVTDVGMKEHIEKQIAKLPVALREALILREYEDCSYNEIAGILGIELSLAKVRVHRARLILRKLLKPLMKELHESR
jgi:RNA polymerase sigma-70 factor, ECF subfamily